jgi:micrococcal nuclease
VTTTQAPQILPITWEYPSKLDRTVDGDTVIMILDLGMHVYRHERIRLARCNAPEMSTPEGKVAASYTSQWMALVSNPTELARVHVHRISVSGPDPEWPFVVRTVSQDNYGRWLAEIWRTTDNRNLSDDLLQSGHAVVYPAPKG